MHSNLWCANITFCISTGPVIETQAITSFSPSHKSVVRNIHSYIYPFIYLCENYLWMQTAVSIISSYYIQIFNMDKHQLMLFKMAESFTFSHFEEHNKQPFPLTSVLAPRILNFQYLANLIDIKYLFKFALLWLPVTWRISSYSD